MDISKSFFIKGDQMLAKYRELKKIGECFIFN